MLRFNTWNLKYPQVSLSFSPETGGDRLRYRGKHPTAGEGAMDKTLFALSIIALLLVSLFLSHAASLVAVIILLTVIAMRGSWALLQTFALEDAQEILVEATWSDRKK